MESVCVLTWNDMDAMTMEHLLDGLLASAHVKFAVIFLIS